MSGKQPKPLPGESSRTFRFRMLRWIIKKHPGMVYDKLVESHNYYVEEPQISKETMVRDVKVLVDRGIAFHRMDGKRKCWYAK